MGRQLSDFFNNGKYVCWHRSEVAYFGMQGLGKLTEKGEAA